jgi:outer membrane protein assembly factor BamB
MPRWIALPALLLLTPVAVAEDWPQWLGPRRDGSSTEKVAPWKGELKVLWKAPVPEGHSSPLVADGKVYLHACLPKKDVEVVDCYDVDKGERVWRYEYERGPFKGLFGRGPRGTPAVVGGKVYAYGATGILTCIDAAKGTKVWQLDARKEYKAPELKFGVSSSPLIVGDKVLVAVGGKGASVVAFDKDTGKELWKSGDDKASYSSPALIGPDTDQAALFLTQKGLAAFRVKDGEILWFFPFEDKAAESSTTPVLVGDKVLISSITLGTALVTPPRGKGAVEKVWMTPDLTCYFSTPVVLGKDKSIYLVTGSFFGGSATLLDVDPDKGTPRWKKDGVGKYHASLLRTGDDKLLMVEEAGNLVLLEPNDKEYRELCRAKICGQTWAHPAVANGRLYIRDNKELVCVQLPQ